MLAAQARLCGLTSLRDEAIVKLAAGCEKLEGIDLQVHSSAFPRPQPHEVSMAPHGDPSRYGLPLRLRGDGSFATLAQRVGLIQIVMVNGKPLVQITPVTASQEQCVLQGGRDF